MPPSDEVDAAYGVAAERAPKGGGGLDLAQVSEQERKLAALVERQRDLERRDRDLTQAIAGAYIGSGDPAALEAEQREVRVQLNQITDVLPVLRARLDAGRVDAYAAVLVEWITNVATPASDKARERIAWHAARIAQLEHELAEVKEKAEQHRERAQLLTDSSRAFVRAFGLDVTPPSPPTTSPGEPLHRTETGRFLQGDQLAEACRAAVAALADDPDGDHALGTAVEALLVARPPKSMLTLNAERREAMDRPHKEAIARVDAWLKEQLAEGPVAYDVLAERAGAAGIAVRNARAPALGWGRCSLGQTAQRLGVFPVVAYDGDNEEELAAAAQWEDDTIYWTLRRTKGLMVLPEFQRSAALEAGMRA